MSLGRGVAGLSEEIKQKKKQTSTSSLDGGVGRHTLCLLAQPKEGQQQFKNKKQPELTENRTV